MRCTRTKARFSRHQPVQSLRVPVHILLKYNIYSMHMSVFDLPLVYMIVYIYLILRVRLNIFDYCTQIPYQHHVILAYCFRRDRQASTKH